MPVLYINNKINHNMKTLKEMTQMEAMDWLRIQNIPVLNGYNKEEAQTMTDLVRAYIDPKQRSCAHCGTTGNLREAKDKFTRFYLDNKEAIESIAYQYHTNMQGIKPLSEILPEDTVEEIYEEINNDYIDIKPIEDIVFGEFQSVKEAKKKKK